MLVKETMRKKDPFQFKQVLRKTLLNASFCNTNTLSPVTATLFYSCLMWCGFEHESVIYMFSFLARFFTDMPPSLTDIKKIAIQNIPIKKIKLLKDQMFENIVFYLK